MPRTGSGHTTTKHGDWRMTPMQKLKAAPRMRGLPDDQQRCRYPGGWKANREVVCGGHGGGNFRSSGSHLARSRKGTTRTTGIRCNPTPDDQTQDQGPNGSPASAPLVWQMSGQNSSPYREDKRSNTQE